MAIDKTVPNRLQTDVDQRFLEPRIGEMVDAQNITISENGESTGGLIKNVPGTTFIPAASAADEIADNDDLIVIGSVSDPQRGYIYWFVADQNGSTQDAIYRQNTATDQYELVLKDSDLNFDSTGFVKADVINGAFQQDGVIQTALFFTDNVNPPRKINVDRAMNSAVYDANGETFDTVVSVCKPAPELFPLVSFGTDADFPQNNFEGEVFQFATQNIYIDGEESAISGYSELAISRPTVLKHQVEDGFSFPQSVDNYCAIQIQQDFQVADLEKVRILARKGNSGSFFVVDEFDADTDLYKEYFGVDRRIFDASQRTYYFYNDSLGRIVSQNQVNKLYDNVPFVAAGQSVSGNRLMFSNYEEGRPNVPITAEITVNYDDVFNKSSGNFIPSGVQTSVISQGTGTLEIDIDMLASTAFDNLETGSANSTTIVPSGTRVELSLFFGTQFDLVGDLDFELDIDGVGETTVSVNDTFEFRGVETEVAQKTSSVVVLTNDTSVGQLTELLKSNFNDVRIRYNVEAQTNNQVIGGENHVVYDAGGGGYSIKVPIDSDEHYAYVDWAFENNTSSVSGEFTITPHIRSISLNLASRLDSVVNVTTEYTSPVIFESTSLNTSVVTQTDTTYITDVTAVATLNEFEKTFKSGSSHSLGVVYYDKFNRSGYVNKIGTAYVEPSARRSSTPGAASFTIDLSNTEPPDWATSYQIVVTTPNSVDDYTQYGCARAMFEVTASNSVVTTNKLIYLSLDTLTRYSTDYNGSREYSFTKGDKLRVIRSYDFVGAAVEYNTASDGTSIEFDILDVVDLSNTDNSTENEINKRLGHYEGNSVHVDDHPGIYLVLSNSAVETVSSGIDGSALEFDGYDWYSITGSTRGGAATTQSDKWGNRTIVEIYTPSKRTDQDVYYEIGVGRSITNGSHGNPILVENGDSYIRPVSVLSALSSSDVDDVDSYSYRTEYLESSTVSDRYDVKAWHRGRPHVVFENAATVRRFNGITYSDAYAEDVANFSLSSFNGSLANFFSLDAANGACNYIGTFRDDYLLAFQENRVSRVPVNKNIITSPDGGSGIVSLSTDVLRSPTYYTGDYGCGDNPESVLIRDGNAFFVDSSRRKVVRLTREGLSPISESGIDSLFKDAIDEFDGNRIVSGFDPGENMYLVTLNDRGTYGGLTLGYSIGSNTWQSRYTFFPDMYADQNDTLYSSNYVYNNGEEDTIFYSHTDQYDADGNIINRNTFYGDFGTSIVQVVSNYNPSMVKVFNAISLEGDSANWDANLIETDLGSAADSLEFVEQEGAYYSFITRDTNGTKHITGVGTISEVTGDTITFNNRVNRNPIPYGSVIQIVDSAGLQYDSIGVGSTDVTFENFGGTNVINVDGTIDTALVDLYPDNSEIVAISEASINGDPVRGHWAQITLTNDSAEAFELYCVNTHFAESKQNHALGQK